MGAIIDTGMELRGRLLAALRGAPHERALVAFVLGGKQFRAHIAIAATACSGGHPECGLRAAAAIELLQSAALIQDDVMDGAATRRGKPALHLQFGKDIALMLSDYLIGRSFVGLTRPPVGVQMPGRAEAIAVLADCISECARGQLEELEPFDPFAANAAQQCKSTMTLKTAQQFVAAITLGPILAGAPTERVDALRRYGEALGRGFQLTDDVLDIRGDAATMGKPSGNSVACRRPMLPLVQLARAGSGDARAALHHYWGTGEDWREVLTHLDVESQIWPEMHQLQRQYASEAIAALQELPPSEWRVQLEGFARTAVDRNA